jgi:hypothetical protein
MSFFDAKQKEESSNSGAITPDILSQVRIMGEKAPSALGQSTAQVPSQRELPHQDNPVSNPFVHTENTPGNLPIETGEMDTVAIPNAVIPTPEPENPLVPPSAPVFSAQHGPDGNSFEKKEHSSRVVIIGSILGVALALIMGIFFYLEKVKDTEIAEKETVDVPAEENKVDVPVTPPLATNPFSVDRANYLSLSTETATKESITAQIKENSLKIQEAKVMEPISFQVTDENNIPLAFSRFVFLLDLKLPESFLSTLDEDFNIVLYSDNGQMRTGLAVKFKEEVEKPEEVMAPVESSLPQLFAPLLYPADITLPVAVTFGTGTYNNFPVRYTNVAPEKMYSFDYIIQNKLLYIGNSKEVTRKTFDVGVK